MWFCELQNAVELTKVLLHLQASGDTNTFVQHRFRAMVALAVTAPIEVSKDVIKKKSHHVRV